MIISVPRYKNGLPAWYQERMGWVDKHELSEVVIAQAGDAFRKMGDRINVAVQAFGELATVCQTMYADRGGPPAIVTSVNLLQPALFAPCLPLRGLVRR